MSEEAGGECVGGGEGSCGEVLGEVWSSVLGCGGTGGGEGRCG